MFDFKIYFTLTDDVNIDTFYLDLEDQIYNMYDTFDAEFNDGLMDLLDLGFESDKTSLASSSAALLCGKGLEPNYSTLTCSEYTSNINYP